MLYCFPEWTNHFSEGVSRRLLTFRYFSQNYFRFRRRPLLVVMDCKCRERLRSKLSDIAPKLSTENLEKLKFLFDIPPGEAEKISNPEGLFQILEYELKITPHNLDSLVNYLGKAGRKDLAAELEIFMRQYSCEGEKSKPLLKLISYRQYNSQLFVWWRHMIKCCCSEGRGGEEYGWFNSFMIYDTWYISWVAYFPKPHRCKEYY